MSFGRIAPVVARYLLAVVSIGAAVVLRWVLSGLTGRESPFLLCLIAVAVTAWYGGVGAALLAAGLGMVETAFYSARHSIRPGPVDEVLAVSFFAIVACAIAFLADAWRRSERARAALLVKEREAREAQAKTLDLLAASEERYQLVATVTNDALWDYDVRRGRVMRVAGMRRVFGYKPEHVGEHLRWWADRIHPDDRDRVMRSLELALYSDAAAWSEQYRFLAGDGSYASVVDRAHIVRHASGHPLRAVGSMLDVTALTQAQRALREGQNFLHRLIRALPALIVLTDSSGRIVLFNRVAEELTGYRRRQAIGRRLAEFLLTPESAERFLRQTADPLSPEVRRPLETRVVTRGGQERVIEWRFAPLADGRSEMPYLLGTGVEVGEGAAVGG
jgi:PAS domain S-box-containing protein